MTARQDFEAAQAVLAEAEAEARRTQSAAGAAKITGDGRYLAVTSLISGKITKADATLGSYVSAGAELFRVADPRCTALAGNDQFCRRARGRRTVHHERIGGIVGNDRFDAADRHRVDRVRPHARCQRGEQRRQLEQPPRHIAADAYGGR